MTVSASYVAQFFLHSSCSFDGSKDHISRPSQHTHAHNAPIRPFNLTANATPDLITIAFNYYDSVCALYDAFVINSTVAIATAAARLGLIHFLMFASFFLSFMYKTHVSCALRAPSILLQCIGA